MASRKLPQCGIAATIDILGEDLLQNIVARLPATSFASAACVNRSCNVVCERVLSRPKLSSACSFNASLQAAVKEVVNKVLSQPIRPHFAIASVGGSFDLGEALDLITAALGSQVPVIINSSRGIIGRDAFSDEFKEIEYQTGYNPDAIMLMVGFLPGLKVTAIPLLKHIGVTNFTVDKFITDIREFSTSVSGSNSPTAIIMFWESEDCMITVMDIITCAMSPETVIVGDNCSRFRSTHDYLCGMDAAAAAALVFAVDRNKRTGIGETQFHAILSSGLSPVGPAYKAATVLEKTYRLTSIYTARREMAHEIIDYDTILNQLCDELGDSIQPRHLCIGVTKERTCSIGQEKVKSLTSLSFHEVRENYGRYFSVFDEEISIRKGDTFRFYHPSTTAAQSSAAAVSSHMKSFNSNTTSGDREVFGGLIFTCIDYLYFSQPNIASSPFLGSFPGVALGGTICNRPIGRGVSIPYVKEHQEEKAVHCSIHACGTVYLIMSYSPWKRINVVCVGIWRHDIALTF